MNRLSYSKRSGIRLPVRQCTAVLVAGAVAVASVGAAAPPEPASDVEQFGALINDVAPPLVEDVTF